MPLVQDKHTPKCQKISFSSVSNPLCLNAPLHFNFKCYIRRNNSCHIKDDCEFIFLLSSYHFVLCLLYQLQIYIVSNTININ